MSMHIDDETTTRVAFWIMNPVGMGVIVDGCSTEEEARTRANVRGFTHYKVFRQEIVYKRGTRHVLSNVFTQIDAEGVLGALP